MEKQEKLEKQRKLREKLLAEVKERKKEDLKLNDRIHDIESNDKCQSCGEKRLRYDRKISNHLLFSCMNCIKTRVYDI